MKGFLGLSNIKSSQSSLFLHLHNVNLECILYAVVRALWAQYIIKLTSKFTEERVCRFHHWVSIASLVYIAVGTKMPECWLVCCILSPGHFMQFCSSNCLWLSIFGVLASKTVFLQLFNMLTVLSLGIITIGKEGH
jgi:hypothetical protein